MKKDGKSRKQVGYRVRKNPLKTKGVATLTVTLPDEETGRVHASAKRKVKVV